MDEQYREHLRNMANPPPDDRPPSIAEQIAGASQHMPSGAPETVDDILPPVEEEPGMFAKAGDLMLGETDRQLLAAGQMTNPETSEIEQKPGEFNRESVGIRVRAGLAEYMPPGVTDPNEFVVVLPGGLVQSAKDFSTKDHVVLLEDAVPGGPEPLERVFKRGGPITVGDRVDAFGRILMEGMGDSDAVGTTAALRSVKAIQTGKVGSEGVVASAGLAGPGGRLVNALDDEVIRKLTPRNPGKREAATNTLERVKGNYPQPDFLEPELTGGKFSRNKKREHVFKPKFKQPNYAFDVPPEGFTSATWQRKIADDMVADVKDVVARAAAGDQAAIDIISQASWYRTMRVSLRQEFGGLGDLFADLLGTTSAKTGVKQNFENAREILRIFSRGGYDKELAAYEKLLLEGGSTSPIKLQKMHKAGEFPLITKASGVLYNSNSPASTRALLGMFRDIKQGTSPKTPNFTGNLIGFSDDATIDVWAARYLRNKAGLPYIPPPVEKAVQGSHVFGSTLDNPKIDGEFAFGQRVFADATADINAQSVIKGFDPSIGDMDPDDLQAVVWFVEKEKWAKNGWTNKTGEGGSLEFEAKLAGAADQEEVAQIRTAAGAEFKPPKQRKVETDEEFAARSGKLEDAHNVIRDDAQADLDLIDAPVERTVLGLSGERPGKVPSNFEQAEMAAELDDVVRNDTFVEAYKVTNTYGRFKHTDERALDAEFVTRQGFDPEPLTRRVIEIGKDKGQDSVFVSKVLRAPTETSRPGVELYFRNRQGPEFAQIISDKLAEKGVDGFTFITDARQGDRINVQAVAGGADTAGLTGIRLQYIPEFDDAYDVSRHAEIMKEKRRLFRDIINEISDEAGVSTANLVEYETKVYKRGDADTDWINGAETYDDVLGRGAGGTDSRSGRERTQRPTPSQSDRSGENGQVGTGTVRDGQRPEEGAAQ